MSSEWQVTKIGDLTVNLDTRRKPVKEADRKPGPYPYYGASGIVDYVDSFLFEGEHLLIAEDGENLRTRQTPIAFMATGKFWVNNHAHIVIGNEKANSRFLQYALLGTDISAYLTGAVMPKLTQGNLNRIEVLCPPLEIQEHIVSVLGSLDDRITLLREANATLEAIAQALFKSWFVDFDPVRAKQEGRAPADMDEATAALFPDGFEESELGLVPKGWRVRGIDETCELGRGSSPRPIQKFMGGDVPWIKIADATASDGMFVFETKEMIIKEGVRNSVEVRPGDLIMSNSASCGITVFVELDGCIHDGWLYFKNYQHISKYFLFFWLRKIADHLVHIADGSVQKNLNIALVSSQKIICPSLEVIRAFDNLAGPLLERIRKNCVQARTLTTLRDTLLPRLISGQLRLPAAS